MVQHINWQMRIRNQHGQAIMEMPDIEATNGKGLLDCPALLDGATVFVQGARNPLTAGCIEHTARPAPEGK